MTKEYNNRQVAERVDATVSGLLDRRQNLHQQLEEAQQRIALLESQIQKAQKLASLGTMACLTAHEFNNILTPIINYADLALRHPDDISLMRKALDKAFRNGQRASAVVRSMLGLARDRSTEIRRVRLARLLRDCFQLLARDFSKDAIEVKMEVPRDLEVHAVRNQLEQVLLNMIINARQAMLDNGGMLTIHAHTDEQGQTVISITDTGCGIEQENLTKIFDPFFSTKNDGSRPDEQGTGLGLGICLQIINAHNGQVEVESTPGCGATFTITLPPHPNCPAEDIAESNETADATNAEAPC